MNPNPSAHPYAYLYMAQPQAEGLRDETQRGRQVHAARAILPPRFFFSRLLALFRPPRLV